MEVIINNWYIILAVVAILGAAGAALYRYGNLPSEGQLTKVREWLVWAVTEAEKELGGGTGKLKLRQVYDLFVTRFTWLARVVSFDLFSSLVDEALKDMRTMLQSNQAIQAHVNGGDSHDGG